MSIYDIEFIHGLVSHKEFEKAMEMVNILLENELEYSDMIYLNNLKIYISLIAY